LLGADEEDRAPVGDEVAHERVGRLDPRQRLLQVDDVDAVALTEDEALHLGVPAPGLVTEVDTGLEQLLHGDDWRRRAHRDLLPAVRRSPHPSPKGDRGWARVMVKWVPRGRSEPGQCSGTATERAPRGPRSWPRSRSRRGRSRHRRALRTWEAHCGWP